MNRNLKLNEDRVFLCARRNCCPSVSYDENNNQRVIIRDDDGNSVRMEKEQAKLIGRGIELLDEQMFNDGRQLLQESKND